MPKGADRRAEREATTSSSESESSDGGIDDDSLLERMAAAARRGARRMTRRSASGHRASRRVERHGGLPLATIQRQWDLAMTKPKARADGVRAYEDDSTSTEATRSGDVAQGHATAGHGDVRPVADRATGHAPPTDAVARRTVRFGEDNAERRGDDGGDTAGRPTGLTNVPAGAKHAKAAHGGARPTTGDDVRRCGESAFERLELAATDVERKTGNGGDSRGGGSDASVRSGPVRFGGTPGPGALDLVRSANPSTQRDLLRSQSAFERRAAQRAERFETEREERGSGGDRRPAVRQPTSRVHRVANFAKWATQVAEAAKADAAAASETVDWQAERRRRKSVARKAPTGETEAPAVPQPPATKAREESGAVASTSRKAARLITSRPTASRHDGGPGIQVGARERRTVPVGHGFRVTTTVDDAADESEQNDDEHQRRLREAAAPRAGRSPELSDDETRKRRRSPTKDNGRRVFGSRQLERLQSAMSAFRTEPLETEADSASRRRPGSHDDDSWETGSSFDDRGKRRSHGSTTKARAALRTSRQRQRWVHQLDALGVLPQGEGRIDSIRSLGAQRQRADAYAAAAARAAPGGAGRPTPVALGSSVQEGLEATAASALSLDELVKLPSYSMARVTSESDDFVRMAPFPVTNVSPAADPMPEVSDAASGVTNPDWRPKAITDVYTHEGVRKIMAWFEEMRVYEVKGVAKKGSGLRRPDDLILDDEYVQPEARGRAWYLLDHVRSGGVEPIVPLEEAAPLAPVIQADRVRMLGEGYHDRRVLDQLCDGHRNLSRCDRVTVLSANHSGALRFHEAVGKQFADDSADDVGWLQPVVSADAPLRLQLDGETVAITGFVATCPARIEPCNGVQQNNKVRTTTDKSWPKLEVLPQGSNELAVNPMIALDELAKSEFPKTTQFAAATAVLMQAEPAIGAGETRDEAAAAAPDDFVWLWKIDLQSAYRFWHNHATELWMYGKQWGGRGFLDCRTQFGDASMVQDFSRFTDFFLWLLRRLRGGDARLRKMCASFADDKLWETLDRVPRSAEFGSWLRDREAAGLSGDDLELTFEAGYIDDIFGAALGADRAAAMRDLAVGLARFLGFEVAPKKIAGPSPKMTVLGAELALSSRILALDPEKAVSYAAQAAETLSKRSMRATDFLSLTCKLVHAAQYRPAGRPYLTCMFTALRQASRSGAKRVRIGRGVVRDLRWWHKALAIPNDGVAFFPLNHFPPSGSADLLEFAYDASGIEGAGAAMLRDDGDGQVVCYFYEHEWTELEKRYHINVKEGIAGYAALTSFYPIAPHRHALAHGDNTTETTTSSTNKSRSALQAVVLQHRAHFAMQTGVVTRVRRVTSKDNVLADPVSRLARATFKEEARKLGATKFVRLPMAPEAHLLLGELAERLGELEEDGEPTSGTASSVAEVYAREQRYLDEKGSPDEAATEPEQAADADRRRWGFLSGFCGADSMSFASAPLGGTPIAGFDVDELVQRLWRERTGIDCWGGFGSVLEAARGGHLDWLKKVVLIYISGSPCPDYSKAGSGRGLAGSTGSLWLDDCELGIRLRPPVVIREMVTGIFDVDGGSPFWAAVDQYRDAGYAVGWAVRMARRHGDPTSRRRVFLVAILPECIVDGKDASDFFSFEGTSLRSVTVESCFDDEPSHEMLYPRPQDVTMLPVRDADGYDGPRLVGTIGIGGMGRRSRKRSD